MPSFSADGVIVLTSRAMEVLLFSAAGTVSIASVVRDNSIAGRVVIKSTTLDNDLSASLRGVTQIRSGAFGTFMEPSWYTFPARRIGYDVDGTRVFLVASERFDPERKGTLTQITQAAIEGLNGDYSSGLSMEGREYIQVDDTATGGGRYVRIEPGFWGEATYAGQSNYVVLFFAEPQRLRAWYTQVATLWQEDHMSYGQTRRGAWNYPVATLEISHDSTNGQDGTWIALDYREANLISLASGSETSSIKIMDGRWYDSIQYPETNDMFNPGSPYNNPYREEFTDGRLNDRGWTPLYGGNTRNVVACRLAIPATGTYASLRGARLLLHLYGEPDVNAGDVRLAVTDPATGAELKKDPTWGNIDHDATTVLTVGIKNMATTLTATDVTVSIASSWPDGAPSTIRGILPNSQYSQEVPWLVSPLKGYLHVSTDAVGWGESISIGDLAPGQTVLVHARQSPVTDMPLPPSPSNVPAVGVIGLRFARIQAVTEGWV